MYIPAQIVRRANFNGYAQKNGDTRIFKDKIVSATREPLLFNIEAGLEAVAENVQGIAASTRTTNVESSQATNARNLLKSLNVQRVDLPKDYSLISSTAATTMILNKNIIDVDLYEKTFNDKIVAIDKYPTNTDPFYTLDEGNLSNYEYERETINGNAVSPRDMSAIASGLVILNESGQYFGQSKYFTKPNIVTTIAIARN